MFGAEWSIVETQYSTAKKTDETQFQEHLPLSVQGLCRRLKSVFVSTGCTLVLAVDLFLHK